MLYIIFGYIYHVVYHGSKSTFFSSPSATIVCIPWHRESSWDAEERRGAMPWREEETMVKGRCGLNGVALGGGGGEMQWGEEMAAMTMWLRKQARVMRCECERCAMR